MDGHAVLVSPFYPEAGFSAGNAMARNKYIYCLADSSLVIHSGKKGGTLNGAEENLKKAWVPLWVKQTNDKDAANADLVGKGGRWLEEDNTNFAVSDLFNIASRHVEQSSVEQADLFSMPEQSGLLDGPEIKAPKEQVQLEAEHTSEEKVIEAEEQGNSSNETISDSSESKAGPIDFYQLFIEELNRLAQEPIKLEDLIGQTQLHKSQLIAWLKRAEDEGVVKKMNRPVRYKIENNK